MDDTRRRFVAILRQFAPWLVTLEEQSMMNSEIRDFGIDSMSVVSIIFELESEFDVAFTDELLTYEVFRTPATIESAVRRLLESRRPGAT